MCWWGGLAHCTPACSRPALSPLCRGAGRGVGASWEGPSDLLQKLPPARGAPGCHSEHPGNPPGPSAHTRGAGPHAGIALLGPGRGFWAAGHREVTSACLCPLAGLRLLGEGESSCTRGGLRWHLSGVVLWDNLDSPSLWQLSPGAKWLGHWWWLSLWVSSAADPAAGSHIPEAGLSPLGAAGGRV